LNWIIIGLVVIGGLVYLAYSRKAAAPNTANGAVNGNSAAILEAANVTGRAAPTWTLRDVNGKPVSLSQFAGHPVVMDFWATWCGPCQIELPWWQQFQKQYASRGLVIVGVSEDLNLNDVRKYLAKTPIDYQIVWDGGSNTLQNSYGTPFGLPTTLFIDRQGKITERVTGLEGKPELDKALHAIL
jgi:thiol-disulfide isomerase/thioredoxin